ncbi:MAG: MBL fold metallo-hydrolase [Deltaproteobacteria bacterium]|nr:MBL fold metallo-hydrolase [Deltaproteobacteria bacterium]
MDVRFWGVRGSIPTPGPSTVEIGGNTSCVEVRVGGRLLIFDGGTGLRNLGNELMKQLPVEAWIFFSHVHWDHIQGFPFFTPAFVRGNTFHLHGGRKVSGTLESALAGQMENPSFPVHLTEMGANMTFHDLYEGEVMEIPAISGEAGGGEEMIRISNARGNHPDGVLAYRVDYRGKSMVYATDTEHYAVVDPKLKKLAAGCDLLVYDSQYTPEEYAGEASGGPKLGWGHSTFAEAVKLAKVAGARQLVLYHHDPGQDDAAVREKERRARELFPNSLAAYEGLTLRVQ